MTKLQYGSRKAVEKDGVVNYNEHYRSELQTAP